MNDIDSYIKVTKELEQLNNDKRRLCGNKITSKKKTESLFFLFVNLFAVSFLLFLVSSALFSIFNIDISISLFNLGTSSEKALVLSLILFTASFLVSFLVNLFFTEDPHTTKTQIFSMEFLYGTIYSLFSIFFIVTMELSITLLAVLSFSQGLYAIHNYKKLKSHSTVNNERPDGTQFIYSEQAFSSKVKSMESELEFIQYRIGNNSNLLTEVAERMKTESILKKLAESIVKNDLSDNDFGKILLLQANLKQKNEIMND